MYDDGFNYLTKMCLTNMRDAAFKLAQYAKSCGSTVIFSSSDATDRVELYLENGADYILIGEGEQTLAELIENLTDNKEISSIAGLAFKLQGVIKHTGARSVMRDLDLLPIPAWDLVNIVEYKMHWLQISGKKIKINDRT